MKNLLLLFVTTTTLFGCSSPKNTYYTLYAPEPPPSTALKHKTRIIVGPVTVPALVDNPQLVVKNGNNQVTFNEYQRWAVSLKADIERVIAANLVRDLSTPNVWSYSQSAFSRVDYQVLVDVQNIDSELGGVITLDVLWTIKPKSNIAQPTEGSATLQREITGRTVVRERVTSEGFEPLVAAQSRAFDQVSQEIARAIRQ